MKKCVLVLLVLIPCLSLAQWKQMSGWKQAAGWKQMGTASTPTNLGAVPAGVGWHELAGTAQVSACPTFLHNDPGCDTYGAFAFSSMVMNRADSHFHLAGGYGHSDGKDPNYYYLDLSTFPAAWHILGTPYVGYTPADCTNFNTGTVVISSYPPNGAPGTCTTTSPTDGTISAASHNTNNVVYSPSQSKLFKLNQNYLAWGNPPADKSIWSIDPTTGAPTVICSSCNTVGQPSNSNELVTWENTIDHKVYIFDTVYLYQWDPATPATPPAKLNPSNPYSTNNSMSGVVDTLRNYLVLIGPNTGSHLFGYIKLDGSEPTYPLHDMTSTADATCGGAVASPFPGMTWDSAANEVVMYPGTSGNGNTIYVLNTSTWLCYTETLLGYDTVNKFYDSPISASSAGRFDYAPLIDAFAWCGQTTGNCFGMRRRAPLNNALSVGAGVNVPGGAASLITASDAASAVMPETFDTPVRHDTGGAITARGICPDGGVCAGTFQDSYILGADGYALKLSIPAGSSPSSGDFHTSISPAPTWTVAFDGTTGKKEYFHQFQFKVPAVMLDPSQWPGSGGFKVIIYSEQPRSSGTPPGSCSLDPSENVVNQYIQAINPLTLTAYYGCGVNAHPELGLPNWGFEILINPVTGCPYYGGRGVPYDESRCFTMHPDEWITVQIHGVINSFTPGNTVDVVDVWLAHEGQPSVLVQNSVQWTLQRSTAGNGYAEVWHSPYMTGVISGPGGWMGFDNSRGSKRRLPDPGTGVPNAPDSLSLTIVDSSHITVNWRVNSQNGTAQDDTGFKVLRSDDTQENSFAAQSFSIIGTTAAGATSYADSGLVAGHHYTYEVYGINSYGNSAKAASLCTANPTASNPCGGTGTP